MKVTLVQATPNPIDTIAQIASICYDSDPKNAMGLVKHLYNNGHHSVFEHIYFTFKIEGISRACATSLYLSCNLRELIHMANERLCTRAQWEIRDLVREMCKLVDPQLQFMLVPKCKSGRIICNSPCGGSV